MTGTEAVTAAAAVTELTAWRHHDERLLAEPGVAMPVPARGPDDDADGFAADLYARGARRVRLPGVVDLAAGPAGTTKAIALVRALTGQGIVVDWRVLVDPARWRIHGHLYPPAEVIGRKDVADAWREEFYLCKFLYRHGPGFIQIRDLRTGELSSVTLDEPEYMAALHQLLPGAPETAIAPDILADFDAESLIWRSGGEAVWLPYRVQRWPWPALSA